jgi:hypothetical protein
MEIIGLRCQRAIYILDVAGRTSGPKSLRLRKRILDATARKRGIANIILNPGRGAISVPIKLSRRSCLQNESRLI